MECIVELHTATGALSVEACVGSPGSFKALRRSERYG